MSRTTDGDLAQLKQQLDSTGPGMCVAKWKQVTMHLQNGHTHSCHHPISHHVPLEEVLANPTALHNTNFKKQQRQQMLNGQRPKECDYCWRVEDQGNGSFSDRVLKSNEYWARPFLDDVTTKPWDHDVAPSYVEVSFGNACNFKCSYCSPHISSKWMEEIQQHGAYPTSSRFNNLDWIREQNLMPIPNNQENPYVDAFWAWWPRMYDSLMHFRITGGEPLLNKNTFRVLDHVIDNPNTNLDLSINTNMCVPKELIDSAIERFKRIVGENKVKKFKLFTSAEAQGAQAEYIRYGMDYNQWLDNIVRVLQAVPGMEFTVMSTYNIMSIPSYQRFLADMLEIKQNYKKPDSNYTPLYVDIPYLRYPHNQTIFNMTQDLLPMIEQQVSYMYRNQEQPDWRPMVHDGFFKHEIDKLKRIYYVAEYIFSPDNDMDDKKRADIANNRRDFALFVDEHDRRRGTNFVKTFPELEDFYNLCRSQ